MLTLNVDGAAWRQHHHDLRDAVPGLVPVAKGNGYGFGLDGLAREAMALQAPTLAVGIGREVETVRLAGWTRDVVVLNPWRSFDDVATALLDDPGVITTVSRAGDIAALRRDHPGARIIVELDTSMHRHGLRTDELAGLDLGDLRLEGWAVHLPSTGSLTEATALALAALDAARAPLWVSHLSVDDYRTFRSQVPGQTRMRVGTRLWLGAPDALRTTATVLDVHPVRRGQRLGYHQHKVPRDGQIVVVSGGTAHGIALQAPASLRTLRQRAVTASEGLLSAAGRQLSPFTIGGRKRSFAEAPHMQASMLFVPAGVEVKVGDEVPVTCRMTTTTFDRVLIS